MQVTGNVDAVLAELMPEEEPATGVAIVPDLEGVPELHVTVGPVTFRLLDRAGLDTLAEAVQLARAAADCTWRACAVCGTSDAMVSTQHDGRVAHLSCSYDASGGPPLLQLVLVQ